MPDPASPARSSRLAVIAAGAVLAAGIGIGALTLADAPSGEVPPSFYAVVSQSPLDAGDVERMERGRVGRLRMLFDWATIDPSPAPGDWDWSAIDPVFAAAVEAGIEPLPFLFGTPPWVARGLDGHDCAPEECAFHPPHSEAALRAWRRFVAAAVGRYGAGGALFDERPEIPESPAGAWQVWNEQNSLVFFRPRPDVGAYARLVEATADEVRAADPGAQVVLGGMFGTPFGARAPSLSAWRYLRLLYRVPGAGEDFDAVAAHPYAARLRGVAEQVERLREAMAAAGDAGTALWVTEIGWSSSEGKDPLERGRAGQARRLREVMDYFLATRERNRIATVTWFAWRDLAGDPICGWCARAGLFEAEALVPKPSWLAFARYTGGE